MEDQDEENNINFCGFIYAIAFDRMQKRSSTC